MSFHPLIKIFVFLTVFNELFCTFCSEKNINDYFELKINTPEKLDVNPSNEICLKYKLTEKKGHISLSFIRGIAYSGEVVIYKSPENIKKEKDGHYIGANTVYSIGYYPYKNISVSDFNDYVYIIVRESKIYYFTDYIILLDSEAPIQLKSMEPVLINHFMPNNAYKFEFQSTKKVKLLYSAEVDLNKTLTIEINGEISKTITPNKNDVSLDFEETKEDRKFEITVENKDVDHFGNEKFALVYYEDIDNFVEIKKNNNIKINYITYNDAEIAQTFYFYANISDYQNAGTINLKLDYLSKKEKLKYIEIYSKYQGSDTPISKFERHIGHL